MARGGLGTHRGGRDITGASLWGGGHGRTIASRGAQLIPGVPPVMVDGHAASYVSKHVRCGKRGCRACPHGPYLYLTWRDGQGKVRTKYVGRAGGAASAPAPPAAPGPTAAEVAAVVQGRAAPVAERLAAIRADIVWTQRSPERVTALLRGMIIDIRSRTDLRDGAWQYSLTRRGTGSPAASGILHGLAEAKEAALAALSLRPSQA